MQELQAEQITAWKPATWRPKTTQARPAHRGFRESSQRYPRPSSDLYLTGQTPRITTEDSHDKKLCPNCEELLKPTSNPEVGQCSGCGWSGHYWRAASEPALPANPPKMPYVSIDIETTGLDPESCQMLEIGAVWDDWTKPIDELPSYRRLVVHKEIAATPTPWP